MTPLGCNSLGSPYPNTWLRRAACFHAPIWCVSSALYMGTSQRTIEEACSLIYQVLARKNSPIYLAIYFPFRASACIASVSKIDSIALSYDWLSKLDCCSPKPDLDGELDVDQFLKQGHVTVAYLAAFLRYKPHLGCSTVALHLQTRRMYDVHTSKLSTTKGGKQKPWSAVNTRWKQHSA